MRRTILTLSATIALALTGCGGGSDDAGAGADTTTSPASPEPEEAEPAADPSDPCSLVTEADVEAAFGEPAALEGPGTRQHNENGLEYTSATCAWESGTLEVSLSVSSAADYEDGELRCPPLSYLGDEGAPVEGLGESATFVSSELDEVEGWLRVCTEDVMFEVEADAPVGSRDVDTLREQNVALAKVILGNLE